MQAARCNPELVALIKAQERDSRSYQWKHNPGLDEDSGFPIGRRHEWAE